MLNHVRAFKPLGLISKLVAVTVAVTALGLGDVQAQPAELDDGATSPNATPTEKIGFAAGSFIFAPVPFENPVIGTGLAIGGAYLFRNAQGADTSTLGFGLFRTDNGSEGFGLGYDLQLGLSGWETSLLIGDVDLTYDLYIDDTPVPIRQTGTAIKLSGTRSVSDSFSLGAELGYAETTVRGTSGGVLQGDLVPDPEFELAKLVLSGIYDTRDDTDYPTDGVLASVDLSFGYLFGSRDREYGKAVLSAAGYEPLFRSDVFAWKLTACGAGDSAPFFDACSLGGTDYLRGYGATEFIDRALVSAQVEYRGRILGILGDRLGYVVFAGAGDVGSNLGDTLENDIKAAYGIGARIRLSESFPVDYAIDVSRNIDGESLLYVTVGQRF